MLSSVLNIGIFLAMMILLLVNIGNIAYLFGVIVAFVSQVFNLLTYVGASCDTIMNVSGVLTGGVILLIIANIFSHFMTKN